jgi:tetratricopeptide (TPR) repeat protein
LKRTGRETFSMSGSGSLARRCVLGTPILKHVVHCAHCSVVLRRASEELGSETTAQEEALLSSLKTSSEGWQKKFANQLAAINNRAPSETKTVSQPIGKRIKRALGWRYVYATAAVILLVAGVWTYKKFSEPPIDRLLARAYSEQRTMELRIAGAEHAPLRQERGAGASSLTKPSSLLKAEYEIESQLAARSEDADALGAKGRAELLEWQYAAAIASLKHALDLTPDSPELLGDLATAYVQRGDTENRPLDYGEAIEYLGRALSKKPNDPVFLFNRALVDERLALLEEASKDWENYLRVDPKGPWADEARERLESLRLKLRHGLELPPAEHDSERAVSLLEARVKGSVDAAAWMESLDEDYFDVAVKEWIPSLGKRLSRSGTLSTEAPEQRALNLLSVILASQHGDPWLSDLLSSRLSSGVFEGLTELGRAAELNSQGDFDAAVVASNRAMRILAKQKCVSGAIRALWEQTYALQRSQQGRQCLGKASRGEHGKFEVLCSGKTCGKGSNFFVDGFA